jgi:hypothetical protein
VNIRKVINKRIRRTGGGVDVAGDINAVIAANVGERGAHNRVSSSQRIVQRAGGSDVSDEPPETSRPRRP